MRLLFKPMINLLVYTYLINYAMEQSPSWEATRFSASQEIPRILWSPKVHYRIHKCPPPVYTSNNQLRPCFAMAEVRKFLTFNKNSFSDA